RLVGRESAQRRGADVVGAVGDRRARKVQRRRQRGQRFGELGGALRFERRARQYIDGRERIETRARGNACAGDHDFIGGFAFRRGGGLVLREGGREVDAERCRDRGPQQVPRQLNSLSHWLSLLVCFRISSDFVAAREPRDVFAGAEGECLDGHGGLAAPRRDQAAAVADEQVRYVMAAMVFV